MIQNTPIIPSGNRTGIQQVQVDTSNSTLTTHHSRHIDILQRIETMTQQAKSQHEKEGQTKLYNELSNKQHTLRADIRTSPNTQKIKYNGQMANIAATLSRYKKSQPKTIENRFIYYTEDKKTEGRQNKMIENNEELAALRIKASTIRLIKPEKAKQAQLDKSDIYAKLIQKEMAAEMNALEKNGVFHKDNVKPPWGANLLRGRFILAVKHDENGYATKIKARFVAMGNQQSPESYGGTRAGVIDKVWMRLLLLRQEGRHLIQLDISNAYQNAKLQEDIYLQVPNANGEQIYRQLLRALYGLKQAGRAWYQEIKQTLNKLGLHCSLTEECLFARKEEDGSTTLQAQYVDDMIISTQTKEVGEDIVAKIQEKYTLRVMGEPKAFLNTEIERDQDKVYLSNKVQIDELVEETKDMLKYDIKPDNIMDTPIQQLYKVPMSQETENQTHEENDNTILLVPETREPHENQEWCHDLETTKTRLKEIIGSLIYVATSCRPDISTAVSMLATRISKPDDKILQDVARLLRYLRHTRNYELCLQDKMKDGKINIEIYADASHDNGAKSKSRMGICVLMNGSLVKWTSKTIASTCRSTTEAEVYAACEATKLAITYKNVIKDIFGETVQPIIYIDNSTCAKIQRDEVVPKETAYMINHFHFAKQYVLSKEIRIESISTKDMLADGLTKALGKTKFWEQNVAWGLVDRTEDYEKIHYVQVYQKEKGKCQNN